MSNPARLRRIALVTALLAGAPTAAAPPAKPASVAPVANACSRPAAGSAISEPPRLHSANGALSVAFSFQTRTDEHGRQLYCFMTPDGLQNPTLQLAPGDTLAVTVTNNTPRGLHPMTLSPPNCGSRVMTSASVNIHYHGANVPPACGADEVIKTMINPGETFQYRFTIPTDEPPGLYWYHPHVHGSAERLTLGGATGALVVGGIEKLQPAVAGLPSRVFLVRDQLPVARGKEGSGNCGVGDPRLAIPHRDLSVNLVPNDSSAGATRVAYASGSVATPTGGREFWRIGNISADTILDLQLLYDGQPQALEVVAIDGVPVNSQDGHGPGTPLSLKHFRLPPASRVELVVTTPAASVSSAQLVTSAIDTGPSGNCDPGRALFTIAASPRAPPSPHREGPSPGSGQRFAGLATAPVAVRRTVFFDEDAHRFYMTVEGQADRAFALDMPPAIVTHVGSVERWIVQNRTRESHEFHIHQIHFLVESQDHFGKSPHAPGITGQYLDTIDVPPWDGVGPYPSVTLRMDFRGDIAGRFVFHCHILSHEDKGMMNIIEVLPRRQP